MMKPASPITRRQFVESTGKAVALTAAIAGAPSLDVLGANEKIRLGFIGLGGRGFDHFKQFQAMDDVSLVAGADVSQAKLDRAKAAAPSLITYKDYRPLLERKDIDGVVIATPDHWHAIPTIQACQAG